MALEVWHIWVLAGIGLMILEIFTPYFLLGSFGIGAFAAAVAAFLDLSLKIQLGVMAVTVLVVFFTIRPLFVRYLYRFDDQKKIGVNALVGAIGKVSEPITAQAPGRVKVGGDDWLAFSADGAAFAAGAAVEVTRVDGAKIYVTQPQPTTKE